MAKKDDWKDRIFRRCFGKPRREVGAVTMFGFTPEQLKSLDKQLKALAKEGVVQRRWIFG